MSDPCFETAGRAEELLRAPLAAAVFVLAERRGFGVDDLAEPVTVVGLAAAAAYELRPWNGSEPAAGVRRRFVRDAARLGALARAVLADPRNSWWAAPLDRAHQLLLNETAAHEARPSRSTGSGWEAYAQKPGTPRLTTSTELPATGGQLPLCGAHAALAFGLGDWWPTYPLRQSRVRVAADARIFEITRPADWHRLVTRYGDLASYGGPDERLRPAGIDPGPAPTWTLVAEDWDAVHLSFVGLLSALYVPWGQTGAATTLWSWEWEQTLWLRPALGEATALTNLRERPPLGLFRA